MGELEHATITVFFVQRDQCLPLFPNPLLVEDCICVLFGGKAKRPSLSLVHPEHREKGLKWAQWRARSVPMLKGLWQMVPVLGQLQSQVPHKLCIPQLPLIRHYKGRATSARIDCLAGSTDFGCICKLHSNKACLSGHWLYLPISAPFVSSFLSCLL